MIRAIIRKPSGVVALAILAIVVLLAIAGPVLAPYDPLDSPFDSLLGPNAVNWLGTDYMGRDVLSRLLYGSSLSVLGAFQVVIIGAVIGLVPGIMSIFLGRAFEWTTLRVIDTLVAIPSMLFAVAVTALIGNGFSAAMFAVGILVAPLFYRVARAACLEVNGQPYVQASFLMGGSVNWVITRHIWRKIVPSISIAVAHVTGYSLVVVSSLAFLGIGVQPPAPTWGGLLASDLLYLAQQPYAPIFPSLLIVGTVAALNLLADTIRDVQQQN
jgi:peptide/nickel transport system permease protein